MLGYTEAVHPVQEETIDDYVLSEEKGAYIVFEGIDGCGKSTQIKLLEDYLRQQDRKVIVTKEPGSPYCPECVKIREWLLNKDIEKTSDEELEAFLRDRKIHYNTFVKEMVRRGYTVLGDRGPESSVAYQSDIGGGDVPLEKVLNGNLEAMNGDTPNLVVVIDVDVDTAHERVKKRGAKLNWFESKGHDFFEKVRRAYLKRAKQEKYIHVVDGSGNEKEVFEQVLETTKKYGLV